MFVFAENRFVRKAKEKNACFGLEELAEGKHKHWYSTAGCGEWTLAFAGRSV